MDFEGSCTRRGCHDFRPLADAYHLLTCHLDFIRIAAEFAGLIPLITGFPHPSLIAPAMGCVHENKMTPAGFDRGQRLPKVAPHICLPQLQRQRDMDDDPMITGRGYSSSIGNNPVARGPAHESRQPRAFSQILGSDGAGGCPA